MTHDSKKFIRMTSFAIVIGLVFALFAYTCQDVAIFVGAFTFIADLVFLSVILSLKANYKRFQVKEYFYMMLVVIVLTVIITILAISQLLAIL